MLLFVGFKFNPLNISISCFGSMISSLFTSNLSTNFMICLNIEQNSFHSLRLNCIFFSMFVRHFPRSVLCFVITIIQWRDISTKPYCYIVDMLSIFILLFLLRNLSPIGTQEHLQFHLLYIPLFRFAFPASFDTLDVDSLVR